MDGNKVNYILREILTLAGVLGVCEEGRGGGCLILRPVSGVLGIELVLVGGGAGEQLGEQ